MQRPARVLVVDDSVVVRHVLVLTLRQMPEFFDATIEQAANGALGLRKLRSQRYDLVLSDVRMPFMDGLEMVQRLRHELGDRRTPIVMISTLASDEDVRRAVAAGANAYLNKPLSPHHIQIALREFLSRSA